MAVSVEKLYELCEILDAAEKDKIEEHKSEYLMILEGAKGATKEKRLTGQLIVRYFHKFPDAVDSALDVLFGLCEDDDVNIRKPIIKDLPSLCKEKGDHVTKVADVLTQLLQTDDLQEQHIVHTSLMLMLTKHTKETLSTIFGHIMSAEEELIRERAVKFMAVKLKSLPAGALTKELEDYIYAESKKVLQDVTGDEFIIFIHLLSNLPQLQTVTGRQQLLDLIVEQADLDKPFDPEDPDRVDQICQCVKQAIPFMSKNVQSTRMLTYLLENVLPNLEQIKIEGNDAIQLEFLRIVADLAPHCGDFETPKEKLQPLYDRLMSVLPLPPSAESTSNGTTVVEIKDLEEDPKIQFSEIECLMFSLHQLGKRHPSFVQAEKLAESNKDFKKRLTYLARVIQVYSRKLKAALADKKKTELKAEENRIKALALKTTNNISLLVMDFLKNPITYKAVVTPSWGKVERLKSTSDSSPKSDEPPAKAARKSIERQDRQIYQPNKGKYSGNVSGFQEAANWREGGNGRGRGRGWNRNKRCISPSLSAKMTSAVSWSIKNGDLDQVRQAFTASNINSDLDGRKPIHFAADYGQNDVIRFLIELGADVNVCDTHGITPLLAAIWEGHTETVKLLLSKGASKDNCAPDGSCYADCAEKPEIKNLLVSAQNCC